MGLALAAMRSLVSPALVASQQLLRLNTLDREVFAHIRNLGAVWLGFLLRHDNRAKLHSSRHQPRVCNGIAAQTLLFPDHLLEMRDCEDARNICHFLRRRSGEQAAIRGDPRGDVCNSILRVEFLLHFANRQETPSGDELIDVLSPKTSEKCLGNSSPLRGPSWCR